MAYGGSTVSGIAKQGILDVVDPAQPDNSLMLRKTLSSTLHAGGAFWDKNYPDYQALRQWIAEGAKNN
jgi:hypothetical protein